MVAAIAVSLLLFRLLFRILNVGLGLIFDGGRAGVAIFLLALAPFMD